MIKEGKATILTDNTFYNPHARVPRDISVLFLSVMEVRHVLDAMAATGIRGIRYALEARKEVTFNDIDPHAVNTIRKNLELNGVSGEVLNEDVNLLLYEKKFQAIDLDPFGSPAPFLHSLSRSITHKGVIMVTATDTAPLSGSSPLSSRKKYHTVTKKVEWYRELAIRVLIGYIQHSLSLYEKTFEPMVSFFYKHHVRVMGTVRRTPSLVTRNAKLISLYNGIGPIWMGPIKNNTIVERMLKNATEYIVPESIKLLKTLYQEIDTIGYYNLHTLSSTLSISPPPLEEVLELLRKKGFEASRSHAEPLGIKTDAPIEEVKEVLLRLS